MSCCTEANILSCHSHSALKMRCCQRSQWYVSECTLCVFIQIRILLTAIVSLLTVTFSKSSATVNIVRN